MLSILIHTSLTPNSTPHEQLRLIGLNIHSPFSLGTPYPTNFITVNNKKNVLLKYLLHKEKTESYDTDEQNVVDTGKNLISSNNL